MNDAFLMGVLHGVADRNEQMEPLLRREFFVITVLRDRHALDVFHDEKRPAAVGDAGIEHPGDVRMIHDGEGLPLGVESGQNVAAVHAGLDQLDGDRALTGCFCWAA